MEIHDQYILYKPQMQPIEKSGESRQALTPESWGRELDYWLKLFQEGSFTPVAAQTDGAGDKEVLTDNVIIKADQYPGMHKADLQSGKRPQPLIEGAPNYREIKGIHGTAQPTIEGAREVLSRADGNEKTVKWINLREEPTIYLNGKPYNLRLKSEADENTIAPHSSAKTVEAREEQLKNEIKAEADKNGGYFLMHEEVKGGDGEFRTVPRMVKLTDVQTTREVFDSLKKDGYKVDYQRLPVSDERAPEKQDFDELVRALKKESPDTPLVFNCHAGKGRTTTAMVLAEMIRDARKGAKPRKSILRMLTFRNDIKEQEERVEKARRFGELRNILSLVRTVETFVKKTGSADPREVDGAITQLTDVLQSEGSPGGKAQADAAITDAALVQDLRKSTIDTLKKLRTAEPKEKEKSLNFLKRYFLMVAFQEYAKDQAGSDFEKPFSQWLEQNPQLRDTLGKVEIALGLTPQGHGTALA
jgi:protein tyrosine/serine phosphatase